jgi:hypothetical protein
VKALDTAPTADPASPSVRTTWSRSTEWTSPGSSGTSQR